MSDLAITVEGLSKRYRIGLREQMHDTLGGAFMSWIKSPMSNLRSLRRLSHFDETGNADDVIWALKDVSFDVKRGEVVGIIGRNGAGKSTLLKVLSRITNPTSGRVLINGRVSSLLEVGTGFHPELTGRENIYLNGTVLGMTRKEIERKFDEIVDFSGVDKFIDTPVKRYSSGMQVRLAFSVAAHLEPEILLVDEVLAVGDAAFQKKCLGKMGDVAKEGRTVLFVSHNMTAVNQLCRRAILLELGRGIRDGRTSGVVTEYLKASSESGGEQVWEDPRRAPGNDRMRLHAVRIISDGRVTGEVDIDKDVHVEVEFWNLAPGSRRVCTNIYLLDSLGNVVLSTANTPSASFLPNEWFDRPHPTGLFRAMCTLPGDFLNEGLYYINAYVVTLGPLSVEARAEQVISFRVFDTGVMRQAGGGRHWAGVVRVRLSWQTEFVRPLVEEAASEQQEL